MIITAPDKLEWDIDDRNRLKNFLETVTGKRVLENLAFNVPKFESGSDPNKALVAAGKVEGYQEAIKDLLTLLSEKPAAATDKPNPSQNPSEEYPDPDLPEGHPAWQHVDNVT